MKILAKSALVESQIEARKQLSVDGIEIIFLRSEIEEYQKTKQDMLSLANSFPIIGIEAPCEVGDMFINPISGVRKVREGSKMYLAKCVELANEIASCRNIELYVQYQFTFGLLDADLHTNVDISRREELEKIARFHHWLRAGSSIPVQIENGTPLHPYRGRIGHRLTTTRLEDFAEYKIPLALDICHLALTLHTWSAAVRQRQDLYTIDSGSEIIPLLLTEEDAFVGWKIRQGSSSLGTLRDAITTEVILQIQEYRSLIGSLQYSNALPGFAIQHTDEGYAGREGLLDLPRILREAVMPCKIPYVVPEFEESDYDNPLHQSAAVRAWRELQLSSGFKVYE